MSASSSKACFVMVQFQNSCRGRIIWQLVSARPYCGLLFFKWSAMAVLSSLMNFGERRGWLIYCRNGRASLKPKALVGSLLLMMGMDLILGAFVHPGFGARGMQGGLVERVTKNIFKNVCLFHPCDRSTWQHCFVGFRFMPAAKLPRD